MKKIKRYAVCGILGMILLPGIAKADEPLEVFLSSIRNAHLKIYGFLENDIISDTSQSFLEEMDNTLVLRKNLGGVSSPAANNSRTQYSIRNSRLGLNLSLPPTDFGLRAEGTLEMDFLGNDAPNTAPGVVPAAQTENNFYNNAAPRVRHAYVSLTDGPWNLKLGQTWTLLGWLPYYLPTEPVVQPEIGELFRRMPLARAMYTETLGDWIVESAADTAKPAESNSGLPEFHAGLRVSSTKYKATTYPTAGTNNSGLSAAVSGAIIPIRTNTGDLTGQAIAFDTFIPIVPSRDGKNPENTVSLTSEFCVGSGMGGLELPQLAAGVPQVTNTAVTGTAIDPGIAGMNTGGQVELLKFQTFRTGLSYTPPVDHGRWTVSTGYAQVDGLNLDRFSTSVEVEQGIAPKLQYGYTALNYQPVNWLRLGLEFSQRRDTYNDPLNRYAQNNRVQFSSYFIF